MRSYRIPVWGIVLAAVSLLLPVQASAESVPEGAIGSVSANGTTVFFYDTSGSGGATAMWDAAVSASEATVTLYADWKAVNGSYLVQDGNGCAFEGVICVPSGHTVTLNLNGFHIDRTLVAEISNGEVIVIQDGGTLNLTDLSGSTGTITGGKSTNSAGGIQIEAGGTLDLWGGSITGNTTLTSGGGIQMNGEGALFYMSGGSITGNQAGENGGGAALNGGTVQLVSGKIADNTAGQYGGGLYVQNVSADVQGITVEGNSAGNGGGICADPDAALSLKDTSIRSNTANEAGGGIFAMASRPVKLTGSPEVLMNKLSDNSQSNLTFWVDETRIYGGGRLDVSGLQGGRIGLGFTGGKGRKLLLVQGSADQSGFVMDQADFKLLTEDGDLYLRRPLQGVSHLTIALAVCGGLILIGAVITAVLIIGKRKKRRDRRRSRQARG